jgi:small subunit ribosomal protein S16
MVVIRLARTGRKKYPTYRIVAADSSRAATGKFIMILGSYNPHTKQLVIDKEKTVDFMSHGARPSNAVIKLLSKEKIDLPKWAVLKERHKTKRHEEPAEKAAAASPAAKEGSAEITDQTDESNDQVRVAEAASEVKSGEPEKDREEPETDPSESPEAEAKQADAAAKGDQAAAEAAAKGEEK